MPNLIFILLVVFELAGSGLVPSPLVWVKNILGGQGLTKILCLAMFFKVVAKITDTYEKIFNQ